MPGRCGFAATKRRQVVATLRKWQPVQRRRQPSFMQPDRILAICGAAGFGLMIFALVYPGPSRPPEAPVAARNATAERERARADALRQEAAQRESQRATLQQENSRQQAVIFNQRYNSDKTPTGSVNSGAASSPASSQTSPGFHVVKPALPGATPGGFREVKWNRVQDPANPP